ncbi:hypothetical protein M3223_02755 [Paenibacillus pasadenensis]|uniref:hypothetical protein n=1 Tax=Paenibacillus pasadenensis TaxID=217090 RepID=UPI00203C4449|nr:hypothetical protein [Paenibacillus pasadenensis]MCM3746266.1 hypothetical protein [Paenibacillus pasadenensis]
MTPSWIRPLRRIGWGLTLILFDVRLGSVDVLPDAIGYILAASGLRAISPGIPSFLWAGRLSWLLVLLSLADPFFAFTFANAEEMRPPYIHAVGQIYFALHAVFVLLLCYGFEGLALKWRALELLQAIRTRRSFYAFVTFVMLLFYPFVFNMDYSDWFLTKVAGAGLIVLLEFLVLRIPFRLSRIKPLKKGGNLDVYG